jgi:hypothetical protein
MLPSLAGAVFLSVLACTFLRCFDIVKRRRCRTSSLEATQAFPEYMHSFEWKADVAATAKKSTPGALKAVANGTAIP